MGFIVNQVPYFNVDAVSRRRVHKAAVRILSLSFVLACLKDEQQDELTVNQHTDNQSLIRDFFNEASLFALFDVEVETAHCSKAGDQNKKQPHSEE